MNNVHDLQERIQNGFITIPEIVDTFERMRNSMLRKAVVLRHKVRHIEHFLQLSISRKLKCM